MTLKGLTVIFLPYIKFCVTFFFLNNFSSPTLLFLSAIGVAFLILNGTFCDTGFSFLAQSKMDFVEMGSDWPVFSGNKQMHFR